MHASFQLEKLWRRNVGNVRVSTIVLSALAKSWTARNRRYQNVKTTREKPHSACTEPAYNEAKNIAACDNYCPAAPIYCSTISRDAEPTPFSRQYFHRATFPTAPLFTNYTPWDIFFPQLAWNNRVVISVRSLTLQQCYCAWWISAGASCFVTSW